MEDTNLSVETVKEVPTIRRMTIARGMGKLKIISKQIDNIADDIRNYAVQINEKKSPLSMEKDINKNHKEAAKAIKAMYQSFQDLCIEATNIKLAIQRANEEHTITIAGKTISIAQALVLRGAIMGYYRQVNSAIAIATSSAEREVDRFNSQFTKIDNAETKAKLLTDVLYLIEREDADALREFVTVFDMEIDYALNEANAIVEIELV